MSEPLTKLENIFVNVEAKDFKSLIPLLAKPLIENQDVSEDFPNKVIEREHSFPTGLPTQPFGVAIPHTDAEFVMNNKVTIATLENPIQMEVMGGMEEDTIEVSIVFLLALGQSNKQLNILQKLMGILNQEDILTRIKNGSQKEIYKIVKEEIQL
jgi:PTS system galactitol-specific IIA component